MPNELANRTERQAANLPIKAGEPLDTLTVARLLAQTGYFADVRDAAQAVAKILAGRELGFGPIASLMGIYFQRGKISYAANLMASAIKRSGRYDIRVVRLENDGCV